MPPLVDSCATVPPWLVDWPARQRQSCSARPVLRRARRLGASARGLPPRGSPRRRRGRGLPCRGCPGDTARRPRPSRICASRKARPRCRWRPALLLAAHSRLAPAFLGRAREIPRRNRIGLGAIASAAVAAAAFALVFALDGGMLTVAFALAAAGTAFVAVRLDIAALRCASPRWASCARARLAWDPAHRRRRDCRRRRSSTGCCSATAFRRSRSWPRVMRVRVATICRCGCRECAGGLFAAFLVLFEIRHAMNGGDPFTPAQACRAGPAGGDELGFGMC